MAETPRVQRRWAGRLLCRDLANWRRSSVGSTVRCPCPGGARRTEATFTLITPGGPGSSPMVVDLARKRWLPLVVRGDSARAAVDLREATPAAGTTWRSAGGGPLTRVGVTPSRLPSCHSRDPLRRR